MNQISEMSDAEIEAYALQFLGPSAATLNMPRLIAAIRESGQAHDDWEAAAERVRVVTNVGANDLREYADVLRKLAEGVAAETNTPIELLSPLANPGNPPRPM